MEFYLKKFEEKKYFIVCVSRLLNAGIQVLDFTIMSVN